MSLKDDIHRIEGVVRKSDVSMAEFFRMARIAASMWTRWRNGNNRPSYDAWEKVEAAARDLVPTKKRAA
jgi:hypothetical protein